MRRPTSILAAAGAFLAIAGTLMYVSDMSPIETTAPAPTTAKERAKPATKRARRVERKASPAAEAAPVQAASAAPAGGAAQPVAASPAAPAAAAAVQEAADHALAPPALSTMREEVRENPHQTPPSLILFARQMAAKMERAQSSPEAAKELFRELQQCVDSGAPQARSVQALCLFNARRLAAAHSELADAYKTLHQSAPEGVVSLLQMMSELGG